MNIRLSQLNPTIGDLQGNKELILNEIQKAEQENIDILVLPELIICGYPPLDLLEREIFRDLCYQVSDEIIAATQNTAVIFGTITKNDGLGRKMFNSAVVAQHGKELARIHKALLPTYDVFDDLRYFEPGDVFEPVLINGVSFGITVCEDIWYNDNEINYHTYKVNPAEVLVEKGAKAIINVSASPYTKRKPESRIGMLRKHAVELKSPLFYVNQTGANTELVYDGDSLVLDGTGKLITRAKRFTETHIDTSFDVESASLTNLSSPDFEKEPPKPVASMFNALVFGLREYLAKTKVASKVILGLSGGIDSALVATIAKEALGAENVIGITMPSQYSSEGSISDSVQLANNLGIQIHEIPIKPIYDAFINQLDPLFKETEFNVAEENLQSRSRGDILMAVANKFGYMLLNTGNKSETAVGYCTLYGDMAGGLAVISDLYKTEVFEMCEWLNSSYYGQEVIPNSIITKEPSAELRPDQKDSDSLPDYGTLDSILEYYLEEQLSIDEITQKGFDKSLIERILRLVDINEHKRFQAAPGLKVSAKAFGSGRRWPIVQNWTGQEQKF